MNTSICQVCQKQKAAHEMIMGALVRPAVAELIKKDYPDWTESSKICKQDLNHYRTKLIEELLKDEKGELSTLDKEVMENMRNQELSSDNILENYKEQTSIGDRLADKIASFGGSWKFIITFGSILIVWILVNAYFLKNAFDPYPYILLNLVLSSLAAFQAPVIMMSQNRQEIKDRFRAEQDYKVNLKSELEVRALHDKIDHVFIQQWQHILEIQQMQIEILEELSSRK